MLHHDVYAVLVSGLELDFAAYVDTAAATSVAGEEEADALISE